MNENYIGVFDSGVGGLTVLKELKKKFPNENFIYFGDTKNLPYGEKTQKTIIEFSDRICSFLINEKKCKAIVIACNTASANAFEFLKKKISEKIPIIDVINPTVNYLVNNNFKNIGLIATKSTVKSDIYNKKITDIDKNKNVVSFATPVLVSLIEEGFSDDLAMKLILDKYLTNPLLSEIDSLILGCTHYPILKNLINDFFIKQNRNVEIITSGEPTAMYLEKKIKELNISSDKKDKLDLFYISDYTENFSKMAKIILGLDINPEIIDI